jgi:hypothetical protein
MTPGSIRRHQAVYRGLVGLTPHIHRTRHGEHQVALFGDLLATGEGPVGLWLRAVPDLLRVFASYKQEVACHVVRVGLSIAGMAPIAVGLVIGSVWLDEYDDVSALFPATAMALLLQGLLGLLWVTRRPGRWRSMAERVFGAGEWAALAGGVIVIALAVLTRSPTNPESLRLLVGSVAAGHAVLGLATLRLTRRQAEARSVTH